MWNKHGQNTIPICIHGKSQVSLMSTAMSCADLISRVIFVSEGDNIHPSSCTRRERHSETSAEILRFTALSRDEGYQSLELSSDNKLETSLLQSSAFFYVRNRHREKNIIYLPKTEWFSWQCSVEARSKGAICTGITFRALYGNLEVGVEPPSCCSRRLHIVNILLTL